MTEIEKWLIANKSIITHFRPKNQFGTEILLAYNRKQKIPLIMGQPLILDNKENYGLICKHLGAQYIEERH